MFSKILVVSTIGLASLAAAKPFSFLDLGGLADAKPSSVDNSAVPSPVPSSVPSVSGDLQKIELQAHGSLPNGAPPATITENSLTSLRLIAFNELFEIAFFEELLYNISTQVPGYQFPDNKEGRAAEAFILTTLSAIYAQEELHAIAANNAIVNFKGIAIQPCHYTFPVDNIIDAIALASTFTDIVLGTLQDVVSLFGADGDAALIRGVASVIGQEGEQNGLYRGILGKIPSALPFLTASSRSFAFSALQGFVVPGSCPNIGDIKLDIFGPLKLETKNVRPAEQNLTFSIPLESTGTNGYKAQSLSQDKHPIYVVYINQQNNPVYEKPKITIVGDQVLIKACFPYNGTTFGNGLTIAALTSGLPVTDIDEVALNTIFGPAIIEIE